MSAEMRYLRIAARKESQRRDCVRDRTIRDPLGVRHVRDIIEERQLKWYGHVCRMGDECRARWLMEARPRGQRSVGLSHIFHIHPIGESHIMVTWTDSDESEGRHWGR